MGTSILPYRYRVNGLIDTSKTAIDNLELIGNSCATWITYDVQDGKWAVVINRAGTSVYSFNDDNIIGAVKLNGTGLVDQYNSVEVRFPHRDLNDQEDFVKIEIPAEDRLPNEPDNCLTMDLPVMNEPIQAQIIGLIELKQARLDKIITFQTDYSMINLQAGNIVDVTNSVYGWTNKLFRIIRMEETDVDGAIVIEFTALEYDANVYSLDDLYRYTRTNADGILTQGALGKPTQPTIVKFEDDPNPRVEITTSTPDNTDPLNQTGIVESIEFWSSIDGTNYTLMSTQKPASALTYASNTSVTFVYNVIDTNFYVKCRCANQTTTGEFSNPTSVIFAPRQITDALNNDTKALDNSGNILNTLGLAGLLKLLDNLIAQNNAAAAGGIFDKFNTTYTAQNGGKNLNQSTTAVEFTSTISNTTTMAKLAAMSATTDTYHRYTSAAALNRANWITQYASIPAGWDNFEVEFKTPTVTMYYDYWDSGTSSVETLAVRAQPAFELNILYGANLTTATVVAQATIDWNSNFNKLNLASPAAGDYWITMSLLPTYALNMNWLEADGGNPGEPNTIFFYDFIDLGAGVSDSVFTARVTSS